jgi:FkbM family methyltransferase
MNRKIFIDCGFHHGEGLKQFMKMLNIPYDFLWKDGVDRHEWGIVVIEPNPHCKAQERLFEMFHWSNQPHLINSAVWVRDGKMSFVPENHFKSTSGSPTDGKSMHDGWASRLTDIAGIPDNFTDGTIEVDTMDFSAWVYSVVPACKRILNIERELYIKMDIEGAEFAVLRKMLADDTVKYIKHLWVEFHERFVPGETLFTKRELIKQLSQFTTVTEWG